MSADAPSGARESSSGASSFTLDVFTSDEPYVSIDGIDYGRSRIEKTFRGDLDATSTVEMLSVKGPGGGAGYVALETVRGTLAGRAGTFAILHAGTMTEDSMWARWPIVEGSATGELEGLTGEAHIEIAPDGAHTLHFDYELYGETATVSVALVHGSVARRLGELRSDAPLELR